jgi:tetratricopeptide (TPR) repeat protein
LIELCHDDPSGYSNRGYAFRKLGDYEAAVEDYSTAISLSGSSSTRLHNNRAYCLAKLGRYQEAIADYDAVVGLDPDNVHAYHNRCAGLAGSCDDEVGFISCLALHMPAGQCCLTV